MSYYIFVCFADENDPLHELLDDLGGEPSLCSLLGAAHASAAASPSKGASAAAAAGGAAVAVSGASLAHLAQTEVCLTLSAKHAAAAASSELLDVDRLFVKTKQLLMCALPCTAEGNLLGCLKSKAAQAQIDLYWRLVDKKQEREQITENNKTVMV